MMLTRLSPAPARSFSMNSPSSLSSAIVSPSEELSALIASGGSSPAPAGSAAPGGAAPEASKAATTAAPEPSSPATAAPAAAIATAPTRASAEHQPPEQQLSQRRREHHDHNNDDQENGRERNAFEGDPGRGRACSRQLNAGILGNDFGHAQTDQPDRPVIITLFEERHCFASEAAHFAVGKDRLKAVAHVRVVLTVFDREQNQHAAIGGLAADSPGLIKLHSVIEDVLAVGCVDGHNGHLRMRLFVKLFADIVEAVFRIGAKNAREIIDVIGRMELRK